MASRTTCRSVFSSDPGTSDLNAQNSISMGLFDDFLVTLVFFLLATLVTLQVLLDAIVGLQTSLYLWFRELVRFLISVDFSWISEILGGVVVMAKVWEVLNGVWLAAVSFMRSADHVTTIAKNYWRKQGLVLARFWLRWWAWETRCWSGHLRSLARLVYTSTI